MQPEHARPFGHSVMKWLSLEHWHKCGARVVSSIVLHSFMHWTHHNNHRVGEIHASSRPSPDSILSLKSFDSQIRQLFLTCQEFVGRTPKTPYNAHSPCNAQLLSLKTLSQPLGFADGLYFPCISMDIACGKLVVFLVGIAHKSL